MNIVPFAKKPAVPKTPEELHRIVREARAELLALCHAAPDFHGRYLIHLRAEVMHLEDDVWRLAIAQLCNELTSEKP